MDTTNNYSYPWFIAKNNAHKVQQRSAAQRYEQYGSGLRGGEVQSEKAQP